MMSMEDTILLKKILRALEGIRADNREIILSIKEWKSQDKDYHEKTLKGK